MTETVQYFAYGANRDPRMLSWITGRPIEKLVGRPATLGGFVIAVQRLDQVPDVVVLNAPAPISPRQILKEAWDDSFTSYVIARAEPHKLVTGAIYNLSRAEREYVRNWELIDFGWYQDDEAVAVTNDGEEVPVTIERMGDGQSYDHVVDGLNYETWLNSPDLFEAIAVRARQDFDALT